ncbi:MAG TPA: hypothetical protein VGK00_05345 [Anaerolineales bacterium]|jgi:hypothetical protein
MKLNLPSSKIYTGAFSILIVLAILLTVVPAVSAEGNGPLSAIPGLGRLPNPTLVLMHKKEGSWYNDQFDLIRKANLLSKTYQDLINAESKAGRNVSDLVDALATFDAEVTASTEIHNQAGAIIYSLIGWTVDGAVKDRLAAGQSLLDGREALRDSNFRLNNAMNILRKSFVTWRARRIHGIPLPPTITPTP